MAEATGQELQRLIADEFGRQGWDYDLTVGRGLVEQVESDGRVDPDRLAQTVSSTFLEKNSATRDAVAGAIRSAIGGLTLRIENPTVTTLVVNGNNYSLNLGAGARVSGNVNMGGTQIVVAESAAKADVLDGVAALIRAGLAGDLNGDAARALADAVAARNDIQMSDVEEVAIEVVEADKPSASRVRTLLASLATQSVSGALGLGLASGLGQALPLIAHFL